ncbi:MAG: ATP-binding cassette domain-containing protein, partial [Bacilli bacterium]
MLRLEHVSKSYRDSISTRRVFDDLTVSFTGGQLVAVVGHSGCGKTTLLNLLGGVDTYDRGDIIVDGVSTQNFNDAEWSMYRLKHIGYVHQNGNLLEHLTVRENIEIVLEMANIEGEQRNVRIDDVIQKLNLTVCSDVLPKHLSTAERKRVSIARALVNDPEVLLVDEPTDSLDMKSGNEVIALLQSIVKSGKLVIVATHDQQIASFADRLIKLTDGRIVSDVSRNVTRSETEENRFSLERKRIGFIYAHRIALRNMRAYRWRVLFTIIVIAFAMGSLSTLFSMGIGLKEELYEDYSLIMNNQVVSIQANENRSDYLTTDQMNFLKTSTDFQNVTSLNTFETLIYTEGKFVSPYAYSIPYFSDALYSEFSGKIIGELPKKPGELLLTIGIAEQLFGIQEDWSSILGRRVSGSFHARTIPGVLNKQVYRSELEIVGIFEERFVTTQSVYLLDEYAMEIAEES